MEAGEFMSRFKKFQSSQQPPVCLKIAMEDFFSPELPDDCRKAYEVYLHRRLRPMVQQLICQDQVDKLEQLQAIGWFTPENTEEFIRMAIREHRGASLMWFLARKKETCGFRKREFNL